MARKNIFIILFVIVFLLSFASSLQTVNLELCNSNDCYSYDKNIQFNIKEPVILKVTFINFEDYWMCWDQIHYKFKIVSDKFNDGKVWVQSEGAFNQYGKNPKFCFSNNKKEDYTLYIPLRDYNNLDNQTKIGEWKISSFSMSFSNLKYYSSPALEKIISGSSSSNNIFNGNEIKFSTFIDENKKGINASKNIQTVLKVLSILCGMFLILCMEELIRNTKKRKNWIAPFIIAVILEFFFVKYGF